MKASRLFRLAVSFAVLLGAYGAYALAVVPWIEPTVKRELGGSAEEGPFWSSETHFLQGYGHLFQEGDWELVDSKLVQLDQAMVLMQEYTPQPDGRLEITPCTVIYQPTSAPGEPPKRPIIMQAPAGATLQFDELDLAAANIGKLTGGLLNGNIHIWSPESEEGAGDRLDIHTYNLQLKKQRVFTIHDVEFRYGESYGSGRDLDIQLDGGSAEGSGGINVGGVRSMELVQVNEVYLVPSAEEVAEGETPAPVAPLQITCAGSFLLDLPEQVASFNEQVNVHRLNPEGPSDQLQCEQLAIHFTRAAPEEAAEGAAAAPADGQQGKMQLARIVAQGTPVIGRGPSLGAEVRGEYLEYDFQRRILDLSGEGGVYLVHGTRRIDAPRVQYQLAEEGKLGRAWAPGPGRVIVRDEDTGELQLNASWQTDVQLRPHEGMHVLSLYGDAQAGLGPAGSIAAKEIHVWLREEEAPAAQAAQPGEEMGQGGIVPDRMMADGGVVITSPQLVAHTQRVELWLEDRSQPGEPPAEGTSETSPGAPGGLAGQPPSDKPPAEQLHVTGELLRVLLIQEQAEWIVENLTLEGGIELVQVPGDQGAQPIAPAQPPLRVVGEFLQMRGVSQTGGTVTVRGAPAVIEARDVITRSDNIQLDRQANRLWIEGPGQLDLPLKGDMLAQPSSPRVVPIGSPATPQPQQRATVTWRGGLDFNGQVFRFDHDIRIAQPATDPQEGTTTNVTGQRMEVVLDQAIDFARPEHDGPMQVRQVALSGDVETQSQTVAAGQLVSRDYMQASRVTFDPLTGRFTATGPGVVRSTRRGSATSILPVGAGGAAGATAPAGEEEQGLNYLEIRFNQGIAGNSVQRQLEFFDRVVTLYGPVEDWDQQLSVPAARAVPASMVVLTCERLQVAQVGRTAQGRGWMELVAMGNTVVEGHNFTARGMRMSYTEDKDLLVMEGDGRSSVQLWRRTETGDESSLAAQKIFFDRRTSDIRVENVTSIDLSRSGITPPTR